MDCDETTTGNKSKSVTKINTDMPFLNFEPLSCSVLAEKEWLRGVR